MKIIRQPIDVIAAFKRGKLPIPYKFKLEIDEREHIIKIDRIIKVTKQKNVGKEGVFLDYISDYKTVNCT